MFASVAVKEAELWFKETLINDPDVIADTKIDLGVFTAIFAATGATVSSFLSFFTKTEVHERTIIEVGILRFPDLDNPHFKVRPQWTFIFIPYQLK